MSEVNCAVHLHTTVARPPPFADNLAMAKHAPPKWSVRSYGSSPGSHAHDHFQVLWGLDGCLALEVEGKGATIAAGSGLVIAPNERHDFESKYGSRCLVLDATDAGWAARERMPQFAHATNLFARFISEAIENQLPVDPHHAALLFAQTWSALPPARRVRREIDWPELARWVESRLASPLAAADLAARACLGESQFRARCFEAQGCSPMQWVRRLRLERARLLRAAGMSVADAAARTGYDSPSALTAALRRSPAR
jgi:AraC-like DNA-binding protein/mannose-6-phosphate isomerase-like protein (cupin superfamily)